MPTILLPTDFSDHALNACAYAFDLFGADGTTYLLVHTYMDMAPGYDALVEMSGARYVDGVEDMAAFVERLKKLEKGRDAVLVTSVVAGTLVSNLVEICRTRTIDAIVMGTQGATGLALFGSNASAVVRGSTVPVLVVPKDARFTRLRKLLLADDRRAGESRGMQLVAQLARRDQAHIVVAHVRGGAPDTLVSGTHAGQLEALVGLEVSVIEASGTEVAHTLSSLAERIQADLMVVRHRHLGVLDSLFHSSTAARLALHSHIPLLVLEG